MTSRLSDNAIVVTVRQFRTAATQSGELALVADVLESEPIAFLVDVGKIPQLRLCLDAIEQSRLPPGSVIQ